LGLLLLMAMTGCGVSRDEANAIAEDHADAEVRRLEGRVDDLEARILGLEASLDEVAEWQRRRTSGVLAPCTPGSAMLC
jgi:hypothetical protein